MSNDLAATRQEMIALLGRLVGNGPLPDDLRRTALEIFASLVEAPAGSEMAGVQPALRMASVQTVGRIAVASAGPTVGNRRLVYVHGICRHAKHFSDPWWASLRPYVPTAFGAGDLGATRLEVVWSDLVNEAAAARAAAVLGAGMGVGPSAPELERRQAAEEIKETLRDRADQHLMAASIRANAMGAAPVAVAPNAALISIPGVNCIDDFTIYLVDNAMRQSILNRFIDIVGLELSAGREIDVISHSWGTVVAYEGLRQLEDQGMASPLVRNFFTVGAALSIGAVKARLRPANRDGRRPANVRRWVNLDAHGDLVGGPLQGRPYAVDFDFLNLDAVGCGSLFGVVSPVCAHSSYFDSANAAVNRDIFARFID